MNEKAFPEMMMLLEWKKGCSLALLISCMVSAAFAAVDGEVIIGDNAVRVQPLSPTLIRIEVAGPRGFEDRPSHTVVNRQWEGVPSTVTVADGRTTLENEYYSVSVFGDSPAGAEVRDARGKLLYTVPADPPAAAFLPAVADADAPWVIADRPRLIPPVWGASVPPENQDLLPANGWEIVPDSFDIYIFLPGRNGYEQLRKEFLALTGPTPMVPLYVLGNMFSSFRSYTEDEALNVVDEFDSRKIPLDVFVADTDWRENASIGYEVNLKNFPDIQRFLKRCHDRGIRVMFNDHPEPRFPGFSDPEEIQFRYESLGSLLKQWADIWWYDRNWVCSLNAPEGMVPSAWGMRLYWDITQSYFGDRRPVIMSNIEHCNNGVLSAPSHPAAHRYPFWWTGDTGTSLQDLETAVENAVRCGVELLMPYVSEDLAGHRGIPTPELFVRYMQFGTLSAICRLHGGQNLPRYPWDFGTEAEAIVSDYMRLRYRLLPLLYAAAHRNYVDGTPILRRLDLEFPSAKESATNREYLLGDDLLVVPVLPDSSPIATELLHQKDGTRGLKAEYFANPELSGTPVLVRTDPTIDFQWGSGSPDSAVPNDNFSVRWSGTYGPVKSSGVYLFSVMQDDGVRVFLDGEKVYDQWGGNCIRNTFEVTLEAGRVYDLVVEYQELQHGAECSLAATKILRQGEDVQVYLPPGNWIDLWSGKRYSGAKKITLQIDWNEIPLFVREGGILLTAAQTMRTTEPWREMVADVYPAPAGTVETARILYEDDTWSNGYQNGEFRETSVELQQEEEKLTISVIPGEGIFSGMLLKRNWTIRVHLPAGKKVNVDSLPQGAEVTLLTDKQRPSIVLMGQGMAPAPEEGSIAEIRVTDVSDFEICLTMI